MPQQYDIGTGFIITNQNDVSTQCDIVVYDKSKMPGIITESHQRFYPVETVVAVCEVKSDINSVSELNKYLTKLAIVKSLREKITKPKPYRSQNNRPFNPKLDPRDQMFTFLICNKLNFNPMLAKLEFTDPLPPRFKHNVVVSINDGAFGYKTTDGPPLLDYPTAGETIHDDFWINPTNEEVSLHFKFLLCSFYNALNRVTLLIPDMAHYIEDEPYSFR